MSFSFYTLRSKATHVCLTKKKKKFSHDNMVPTPTPSVDFLDNLTLTSLPRPRFRAILKSIVCCNIFNFNRIMKNDFLFRLFNEKITF